jgi:acyl CoA:acetate/3-ketoacid CoA transferase beta subunit
MSFLKRNWAWILITLLLLGSLTYVIINWGKLINNYMPKAYNDTTNEGNPLLEYGKSGPKVKELTDKLQTKGYSKYIDKKNQSNFDGRVANALYNATNKYSIPYDQVAKL